VTNRVRVGLAPLLLLAAGGPAAAAEVYVAPAGSDDNPGTLERPFATVQRAQAAVGPGDTVFVRGGTYRMTEAHVARRVRIWAYVTHLDRSGAPGRPITYAAYRDERPVFDFSAVRPAGLRVDAFHVSGSWVHLRGLEVTGVQVTVTGHTQSIGFENTGSHNVYERLAVRDGQAIGFYLSRGSDNLFLNCDAWNNRDRTSEDKKGGNVDGFGCHPPAGSTGNVFRGCRAWFNSDDGFDCIGVLQRVLAGVRAPGRRERVQGRGVRVAPRRPAAQPGAPARRAVLPGRPEPGGRVLRQPPPGRV